MRRLSALFKSFVVFQCAVFVTVISQWVVGAALFDREELVEKLGRDDKKVLNMEEFVLLDSIPQRLMNDWVKCDREKIVISEVMVRPVLNEEGQWIELYNPCGDDINIFHWIIQDSVGSHVIEKSIVIPAHSFTVVSRYIDGDELSRYGYSVAYTYGTGITFSDNGDDITLLDNAGAWVDSVVIPKEAIVLGISIQRDMSDLTELSDIHEAKRCLSESHYERTHSEKASPGVANTQCESIKNTF